MMNRSLIATALAATLAAGTAHAQTPPPVMVPVQRQPISPGVVATMAPQKQGDIECVAVNNITVSHSRNFTCIEASGKQTKVNFYELYQQQNPDMDKRIAYYLETQIDHSEAMNLVAHFFVAKASNPALKARLHVNGLTNAKGVYEAISVTLVN